LELNKKYKSALVTGGAQRIGESISKFLASSGFNVAIQYNKSKKNALKIKNQFKDSDVKISTYKFDFEKGRNITGFYEKINKDFGNIDILINNASAFDFDTIKNSNELIYNRHMNINLKAPFFLSQGFAKYLGSRNGLIINILDQRVKNITPYFTSYTISKVALYTLTKSLSLSLAPKIRVNGISPGPTLMSKNQTKLQFKKQISRTPLKKQIKLSEINSAVSYLVNNLSVTGEILTLDSGQSLGWAHSKSKVFTSD